MRTRRRWTRFILPGYVGLVFLYTLVPIGVMVLYGFNNAPGDRLTFAWHGFTLDWYKRLFEISDLTTALVHSLEIATLSTLIATAIGTPMALAMTRHRFHGRGLADLVILADVAAPSVVVGASLLGFYVDPQRPAGLPDDPDRACGLQRRLRRRDPQGPISGASTSRSRKPRGISARTPGPPSGGSPSR